eukprot:CAMPEP_0204603484 /NCGR_PEP_ID=MMETSP0661-20131031/57293_1 /ASSEMBLY_ACC=CAM_ASM_000606 /TAXON_ID=109239 /ORGANISM="Alexandrium margalefi, Strain AMGDE01CS-322" /LENGTH=361 /DNA_ID=CAMNT_0051614551 /DNA_START=72 /DNA_END=1157 /DNA_ORIENTATION=+
MTLRACSFAALVGLAHGQDGVALLQHSLEPHAEAGAVLNRMLEQHGPMIRKGPEFAEMMGDFAPSSYLGGTVEAGKKYGAGFKAAVTRGWKAFFDKSHRSSRADPQTLLSNAKTALIETGAMQQMRHLAATTMNASRSSVQGAVPLDSMMVGFRTSVAPWNNVLKMFAMPLVKASFTVFTNFFGPDGNAARLCIGAQVAADSTYGTHTRSEFGGVNIWIGPAKWDNVPGWSFGSSGGLDDIKVFDVADFGWTWTLAREPETVCFFYDICIVDSETLHAGMIQTQSQVETAAEAEKAADIAKHGSTWIQHIWCSPDWDNTPLVIPDDAPVSSDQGGASMKDSKPYFKAAEAAEEWDPESEAV